MPQLDIATYPSQIFWLLVCFGVLCFAIVSFLAPRLGHSIAHRRAHLDDLHRKSATLLKEAHELHKHNQEQMRALRQELSQQHRVLLDQIQYDKTETLRQYDQDILKKIRAAQQTLSKDCQEIIHQLPLVVTQVIVDLSPQLFATQLEESVIKTAYGK